MIDMMHVPSILSTNVNITHNYLLSKLVTSSIYSQLKMWNKTTIWRRLPRQWPVSWHTVYKWVYKRFNCNPIYFNFNDHSFSVFMIGLSRAEVPLTSLKLLKYLILIHHQSQDTQCQEQQYQCLNLILLHQSTQTLQ